MPQHLAKQLDEKVAVDASLELVRDVNFESRPCQILDST
jgi:hypothetical protein